MTLEGALDIVRKQVDFFMVRGSEALEMVEDAVLKYIRIQKECTKCLERDKCGCAEYIKRVPKPKGELKGIERRCDMKREFRELGSWVWTAEKNKFMEDMAECVSSLTKRVIDLELLLAKLAEGKEYKKLRMVLDRKEKDWLNLSLKEDK